jgi:holin-like protein
MAYVRQFGIILGVTLAAELIKTVSPLPVPAGVYGLILMLAALKTGVIKLHWVDDAAMFLVGHLQLMFIPAAAGLMASYGEIRGILPQSVLLIIISTAFVTAATGLAVQGVQRLGGKKGDNRGPS